MLICQVIQIKVTMILISLATAIGGAGIPLFDRKLLLNKDKKQQRILVINSLQMLCMVLFPAMLGAIYF